MTKRYLIIGTWHDKKNGKPFSSVAEITKGLNKDGKAYEIASTDRREALLEGTWPVGTIISAQLNFSTEITNSNKFGTKTESAKT